MQTTIYKIIRKWSAVRIVGISSFLVLAIIGLFLLVSTTNSTQVQAQRPVQPVSITTVTTAEPVVPEPAMPAAATLPTSSATSHTVADEIPNTIEKNIPVSGSSISKNSEVVLSDAQAKVAQAFGAYLQAHGEWAIVTSGTRTKEGQLSIIKEKIAEHGATSRFPKLQSASLFDTKIWLKAWQWLKSKHVPVNAPEAVPGADVRTSMHIQGLAIDFIATNLDRLRGWLADFSHSRYAQQAPLRITGIIREPGCVHINLG